MAVREKAPLPKGGSVGRRTRFDADRGALVRRLQVVGDVIEQSATEFAMIAVENVFDPRVSKILFGEARAMRRMVRGLKQLRIAVARAGRPQA